MTASSAPSVNPKAIERELFLVEAKGLEPSNLTLAGLDLTPPESTIFLVGRSGTIRRRDVLSGLIHEYELAA